ncbi:DNA/RNA nuclease SfsA [Papillibacter cinnamivorans]|uniref:Sugar fermentation stimulation protein homolog n=1 Tax=Papillibacter cinnamivorans DSM 12816 TaxID=1122930 RepID=A0A1W2CAU0_9FIRM|nr:DNA/RNA nuclease SfsA [Papillibacter cinnamivorans]SMC81982.1 sugar fermentation stimulation protein A [Papillibacter cinnamivorans DSM 12816]
MRYDSIRPGVFLERPNRFIARVLLDGREEVCHVKNTGRCTELLLPGTEVWLSRSEKRERKTRYDLVTVRKGNRLINIDSQAPNRLFREWISTENWLAGISKIRAETVYGASRLDFRVETESRVHLVEVKGVTLEEGGTVRFPDAPTLRGLRHVRELTRAAGEGFGAAVFFIVQMDCADRFMPNWETQPEFGFALREAQAAGVEIRALQCRVEPGEITVDRPVPVLLDRQSETEGISAGRKGAIW